MYGFSVVNITQPSTQTASWQGGPAIQNLICIYIYNKFALLIVSYLVITDDDIMYKMHQIVWYLMQTIPQETAYCIHSISLGVLSKCDETHHAYPMALLWHKQRFDPQNDHHLYLYSCPCPSGVSSLPGRVRTSPVCRVFLLVRTDYLIIVVMFALVLNANHTTLTPHKSNVWCSQCIFILALQHGGRCMHANITGNAMMPLTWFTGTKLQSNHHPPCQAKQMCKKVIYY